MRRLTVLAITALAALQIQVSRAGTNGPPSVQDSPFCASLEYTGAMVQEPGWHIWGCAPTPMVIETPGLAPNRVKDLKERSARLQELIVVIRQIAEEKKAGFIDLNAPLAGHPEFFTDGVHLNEAGYRRMAELVHAALQGERKP